MPINRRQLLALGAVAAGAAAGGALLGLRRLRRADGGAAALLEERFTDLEGRAARLRDFLQPVLLCNFWATWCDPCREEVPLLVATRRRFAPKGLEIAGIGVDTGANLRQFAKKYDIPYPVLVAPADATELLRRLGDTAAALPYSVLLDRRRSIVRRKLGAWKEPELTGEIKAAIG